MFEFDRDLCERCGVWVSALELASGRHECESDLLVAFQTRLARAEIEQELESTVRVWEQDPRLANRLAFARYLEARAAARSAAAQPRAA